jgi:hypothetical protein
VIDKEIPAKNAKSINKTVAIKSWTLQSTTKEGDIMRQQNNVDFLFTLGQPSSSFPIPSFFSYCLCVLPFSCASSRAV